MKKYIILLVFSILSFILIITVTQNYNLGMSPDSVSYLEVAKNLQDGKGITGNNGKLVSHWPPFYPLSLVYFSNFVKIDILESARYFSALLFAITFILFNLILKKFNLNFFTEFFLNALLLFSTPLTVFLMMHSEGLFLVLLLAIVYLILFWIKNDKKVYLIMSAILSGLMILTRYAGIGFIGGIILFLLFFKKNNLKNRIINSVLFSSISFFVFSVWIFYARSFGQAAVDRKFVFHIISFQHIVEMLNTFLQWFFPVFTSYFVIFTFILLIIFFGFNKIKYIFLNVNFYNIKLLFLITLIISYILFLFVSISFFDVATPLNNRILAPIFPFLLIILSPIFDRMIGNCSIKKIIILNILIFGMSYLFVNIYHDMCLKGSGYSGKKWIQSEIIQELQNNNYDEVYTNEHYALRLYLSHEIKKIPMCLFPHTFKKNESFDFDFNKLKESISLGKGALVYFDNIHQKYFYPSRDFILNEFENYDIKKFNDGFIIGL
ncbi:MAG: hypothetical protein ACTSUG_13535 [Candidatus Helarchaeota archaeon]